MDLNAELASRARELLDRQPGLGLDEAYRRVLFEDPALAARWNDAGRELGPSAGAGELVDPGALLLQAIHARVAAGADHETAQRAVFADYPAVADAYCRGELVRYHPDKVGAPRVTRFSAPLAGEVAGAELRRVAIFRSGTWNARSYGTADLDAMVEAFTAGHYAVPVKLGHDDSPGVPAVGRLARVWREGGTLYADLADVDPDVLAGIRSGRWLSLSAEVYIDFSRGGKRYPAALRSIAILGGHPPGVDLPALRASLPAAA